MGRGKDTTREISKIIIQNRQKVKMSRQIGKIIS